MWNMADTKFGIPGNILANYLRENGIIPEKCDLNDILFLMTPAETATKMDDLVAKLVRFEKLIDEDAPMSEVLRAFTRLTRISTRDTPSAVSARKCMISTRTAKCPRCRRNSS